MSKWQFLVVAVLVGVVVTLAYSLVSRQDLDDFFYGAEVAWEKQIAIHVPVGTPKQDVHKWLVKNGFRVIDSTDQDVEAWIGGKSIYQLGGLRNGTAVPCTRGHMDSRQIGLFAGMRSITLYFFFDRNGKVMGTLIDVWMP